MQREDIIKLAREAADELTQDPYSDGFVTLAVHELERFIELVAAAEREACAKVADEWQTAIHDPRYECDCAAAIRARGG